jgi:hypothetical protein
MRPRVFPSSASTPHLAYLSLCVQGLRPNLWWSGGKGRGASSALGSDEAGDDDMDKATRAAIARACEANRGNGGGESGAREGGEGGGEGGSGGGWLSGLSAAAPKEPPDVELGSANRGPRRQQGRVSEAKHGRGGGEGEGGGRRRRRRRRSET